MGDNNGSSECTRLALCLLLVGCASSPPAETPAPAASPADLDSAEPFAPLGPSTIDVLDGVLFATTTRPDSGDRGENRSKHVKGIWRKAAWDLNVVRTISVTKT